MKRLSLAGLILCLSAVDVQATEGFRSEESRDLDVRALSKAPQLVHKAAPEFPTTALAQGAEAEIRLLLDLDEHGQVVGAVVVSPQPPTQLGFEEAAQAAAYQLGFEPAEIDGKPVAVQVAYTFKFVAPKPAPVAATAIEEAAPTPKPEKPATPAPPPSKSLVGTIRERGTRVPMPGTLVTVHREDGPEPVGFEYTAEKDGRFTFFDLAPGVWQVTIEVPGYRPFHTTEEMRQGEMVDATYFIERGSYNPFDVVVEATRPRKEVTRVIVEKEIIEKVPGAMGDALTALQNYAGVARVGGFEDGVIVRGSAPRDTKVFVDGVEIPIAYHFGGLRSVLSTGMIESLQFYPGNFSSYYGRAIGGVIDVDLKKPRTDRWNGYVDINLLDAGFFLEAPITSKLTLSAAARRSYIDTLWNALIPENTAVRVTQLPVYYDYQFLANYRPAPAHDLRLFVFGSDDAMTLVFKNSASLGPDMGGNRLGNSTTFQRAMASYRYVPNEDFENTFRLSVGRDRNDQVVGQFVEHLRLDSLQLRDTARLQLSKRVSLIGGVDSILQHWSGTVRMPQPPGDEGEGRDVDLSQTISTHADEYHWLPGGFAGVELTPIPGLLLTPGVRFDYFSKIKDATVAPRLSARYPLGERWTVKGGVGLYYQEPAIDQSNEAFGNPRLKAERALHYAGGAEVKALAGISVDVTGFYKDLSNQVSSTTATRVEDGRDVALRYDNHGVGRVVGMELVLRRDPVHRLSGWVAYTLSRSERRDSGTTDYRLFQYDQTHILTAVAMWRFGRNWQLSSRFRLVSGKPETPVKGATVDLNSGEYKPIYGAKFSARNPMFAQWDLRIDKKWVFDRFMLDLYLDVQNVTNRSNVEAPDYNFDYSHTKTETGFPIYPILGLRAEL